jgi:hypothetical protein
MIVSISEYIDQIGNAPAEGGLLASCLASAQKKVEDEVGYELEIADYVVNFLYRNSRSFNLGVYKINAIDYVEIDGATISPSLYVLNNGHYVDIDESVILHAKSKITIRFNAGWIAESDSDSTDGNCPEAIKQAIIFIAQSLSKNKGAGGVVNQQSFGNQGSVTYDTTRYFRFYDLIKGYKVFKM